MGRVSRKKHPSRRSGVSSGGRIQSILSYRMKYPHIKKSDIRDFLIPVMKEVGKAVYPPAAVPIEILYQIYKHADAVNEVGSAVMKGDYEQAAKTMRKEVIKEAGEAVLEIVERPIIARVSESASESTAEMMGRNIQEKETIRRIVKGAIKGVAEAKNEKIADKVTEEVVK